MATFSDWMPDKPGQQLNSCSKSVRKVLYVKLLVTVILHCVMLTVISDFFECKFRFESKKYSFVTPSSRVLISVCHL